METQVTVHTFSRVASYSFVASAWGTANQYYFNLKNSDRAVVRGALETAERLVAPAIATFSQVPNYCPTVVQRLDSIAMSQLDHAENIVSRSSHYAESTKVYAERIVGQSSNYIQSTTTSIRDTSYSSLEKGKERVNNLIQPIASTTATVIESPRTFVSSFFQKNSEGVGASQQEVSQQGRASYLTPIFRFTENITTNYFVDPLRNIVSNVQNNEQVKRVSSSLDQRRKFAMEMFRATKSSGEKKLTEVKHCVETSLKAPVQIISDCKNSSRQILSNYVAKGIFFQKSALGYVRNAVQYFEKQQSEDSPHETNYAHYVPPFVFRYTLMSIDVSDLLLTRTLDYLESLSKEPQPIPASAGVPNGKSESAGGVYDEKPFDVIESDDDVDDIRDGDVNHGWDD